MIVVNYKEQKFDSATNSNVLSDLGTETFEGIEEVLLPLSPSGAAPVFCTKKFKGSTDYRWEVLSVTSTMQGNESAYVVTLSSRPQVHKSEYLPHIFKNQKHKHPKQILYQYALVEVEYGHTSNVGKFDGSIESNKRYVDTLQYGSMPKRRLAIVNQVIVRAGQTLVQVIPITSNPPPNGGGASMVEVTSCLSGLVHYMKPSWAVCSMIETVAPSRIMAPLYQIKPKTQGRVTSFPKKISGTPKAELKEAILHGIASSAYADATRKLEIEEQTVKRLADELALLQGKLDTLMANHRIIEDYANKNRCSIDEVMALLQ